MKLTIFLTVLTVLVSLALAQPVTQEPTKQVDQVEIEAEGPSDVEVAVSQLLREEARKDVADVASHSRQKRATCRCYRRASNIIVCYCR